MSTADDYEDIGRLRVPPKSQEAEQSVIGGLLLDNNAWDRVGDVLKEADFFDQRHRVLFAAIAGMINAGRPADVLTVHDHLSGLGLNTAHDIDLGYINALAQSVVSANNIRRYAEIVREKATLRALIAVSDETATACFNSQGKTPIEILEAAALRISGIERGRVDNVPVLISDTVMRVVDRVNELHEQGDNAHLGYTTGFPGLDDLIGGFQGGKVYLLGGRPGMGKTALALQVAARLAVNQGIITTYLSQEMGKLELGQRATANVSGISYQRLKTGKLQDIEYGRLSEGIEKLGKAPMHIDCESGLSQADVSIKFRYIKGMKVGVLDYIQLCSGIEEGGRNRNTVLEGISRSIKQLAMKLDAAIIVLSALNRKVDERPSGRAIMSDFKDCGALEADADWIGSLFECRPKDSRGARIMGLDTLKQRDGPVGSVALDFFGEYMAFSQSEYLVSDLLKKEKSSTRGPL